MKNKNYFYFLFSIFLFSVFVLLKPNLKVEKEFVFALDCPIKTIGLSRETYNDLKSDLNIINEVKALQTIFSKIPNIGWQADYKITGSFGYGTEGLLRRFQRAYGLNSSGIIDEATRDKLCEIWEYQNRQITPQGAGGGTQTTPTTKSQTTPQGAGGGTQTTPTTKSQTTSATSGGTTYTPQGTGAGSGGAGGGYKTWGIEGYKTCYKKVWSRGPGYCGSKPYCCVPWYTTVKEEEPCPANECESDSDPTGQYLKDPEFVKKGEKGIYKSCYQKKCTGEEKCVSSFIGYVDTSKGQNCPQDLCVSDLECKSNVSSNPTKKCVYNQCIMFSTNQYPSDTGLSGLCWQVIEYIPKNQSCPGSGCKYEGGSCGYDSIRGFWYNITYDPLKQPMCQVKKCFNNGTPYARCETRNVPGQVVKTSGNYYTLKCESNECETSADCGGANSLTTKQCNYNVCDGAKCKKITTTVGLRDVCPKDQCLNDQECKDIQDGKSKACDYKACWITAGSATCVTKRIKAASSVDCNSRYPNECNSDSDCENKKRPPCEFNSCTSDGKCLRNYYENCPFETVPASQCRLGHNEDCQKPENKSSSYKFSCWGAEGCIYDPVGKYKSLEDCLKDCEGKQFKNTAWVCDYATGKCHSLPANTAYLFFNGFGGWSEGDGAEYWCNQKCYVKDEYKTTSSDVKTCKWTVCDNRYIPPKCVAYENTNYPKDKDCPPDDKCAPGTTCIPPGTKEVECNYLACENGTCKRKIVKVSAVYSGDPYKLCPKDHPDCWAGSGARCSEEKNPNRCQCIGNTPVCAPSSTGEGKACNSPQDCPSCNTSEGCPPGQKKYYYECYYGQCVGLRNECGVDLCKKDEDCIGGQVKCPPGEKYPHYKCEGDRCIKEDRCGVDQCKGDEECKKGYYADQSSCSCKVGGGLSYTACQMVILDWKNSGLCGGTCPSGLKKPHNECIGGHCIGVPTCGVDQCQTDSDCGETGTKECEVKKYDSVNKICKIIKITVKKTEPCPADDPQCGGNCIPNCTNKECGPDGCGGSCGSCFSNEICSNFKCVTSGGGYYADQSSCSCKSGGGLTYEACQSVILDWKNSGLCGGTCPSGLKKPHYECQGGYCKGVNSCGVDQCQTDSDCGGGVRYKCIPGVGCEPTTGTGGYSSISECEAHCVTTSTSSSQTKDCSVKYCSGNACNTKIVKVGINEACPSNECEVNLDCYQKQPDPCAGAQCGICAGKDYGSCPVGYKCVSGYKCVDVCEGYECGTRDGKNCGTCPSGYKCENYQCVKDEKCTCSYCYQTYCITDRNHTCPCPSNSCDPSHGNKDCGGTSMINPYLEGTSLAQRIKELLASFLEIFKINQ